ncbi:hypothetical protein YO5_01681 [Stutzerimonas stutzeri TS44]|nr:hypothetical protein YO5_01681 [Stutzerimonas stutzeri TS44]
MAALLAGNSTWAAIRFAHELNLLAVRVCTWSDRAQITYRMFGLQTVTKQMVGVKLSNHGLLSMISVNYREQD